jgi:hypothetical protein
MMMAKLKKTEKELADVKRQLEAANAGAVALKPG